MAHGKHSHWKPKNVFLLPSTYKSGDRYPNEEERIKLQNDGFGSCSVEGGLDRTWTIGQLEKILIKQFPRHETQLNQTGIHLAKIKQGSRKIEVHDLTQDATVADLQNVQGQGILVIIQKPTPNPSELSRQTTSSPQMTQEPNIQTQAYTSLSQMESDTQVYLTTAHLNIHSLQKKTKKVSDVLSQLDIHVDVITLSESWLKSGDSFTKYRIPGYTMLGRRDGKSKQNTSNRRGGVITYVKDEIANLASRCPININVQEFGLDVTCTEINLEKNVRKSTSVQPNDCTNDVLRIVNVYVSPGTRDQIRRLKELNTIIKDLKNNEQHDTNYSYVILGDFNCDRNSLEKSQGIMESVNKTKLTALDNFEDSHNLTQLIQTHTRVASRKKKNQNTYITTKSLIDLIYTDDPANVVNSGVVPTYISDHYMVFYTLKLGYKERGSVDNLLHPYATED